jgi:uncharacterized protein (DUF58 family)
MLNGVLERAVRLAKHDFLVCFISDGAGADQETVRLTTLLSTHNDVLTVFIYDPLEARLPPAGRLVMADGELQLEVNTSDRQLRQRYDAEFGQRLERIRELSRQREIPVLPLSTATGVAAQVRELLGHQQPAPRL